MDAVAQDTDRGAGIDAGTNVVPRVDTSADARIPGFDGLKDIFENAVALSGAVVVDPDLDVVLCHQPV